MADKIYILNNDYKQLIQDEMRDEIVDADSTIYRECEEYAIEEMMSYLSVRFDVTNLFPALMLWNSRHLYLPGDYVDYQGTFMRALKPTEANATANRAVAPVSTALSDDGEVGEGFYWTDYTFPNIQTWASSETVPVGAYREKNNEFFRCEVVHTNQDPATASNLYDPVGETGYWTKDDPRNPKLVEICCKLALYKVHARISPHQIPELRLQDHDMAIEWLKGVAAGDLSPKLPEVAVEEENKNSVQAGSETRRNYTF